jgi:hypothetical protein
VACWGKGNFEAHEGLSIGGLDLTDRWNIEDIHENKTWPMAAAVDAARFQIDALG